MCGKCQDSRVHGPVSYLEPGANHVHYYHYGAAQQASYPATENVSNSSRAVQTAPSLHYATDRKDVICRCNDRAHRAAKPVIDSERRHLSTLFFQVYTDQTRCSQEQWLSSWMQRMVSRDPNLRDVFDTFRMNSTYGEALRAVNQRIRDSGHVQLDLEGLFKLLRMLRPNRFAPTITLAEAFESRDIEAEEEVGQSTRCGHSARAPPAPKPAPIRSDLESKTLSSHARRTEAASSGAPHPSADPQSTQRGSGSRQTAKSTDDVPAHELSSSPSQVATAAAHPSAGVDLSKVQQTKTEIPKPGAKTEADVISAYACFKRVREVFPGLRPESIRKLLNAKPSDEPYTTAWADEIILNCLNSGWYPHGEPHLLKLGVESKLFGNEFKIPPDRDGQYGRHPANNSKLDGLLCSTPAIESPFYNPWQTPQDFPAARGSSHESSANTTRPYDNKTQPGPQLDARPSVLELDAGPRTATPTSRAASVHTPMSSPVRYPWGKERTTSASSGYASIPVKPSGPQTSETTAWRSQVDLKALVTSPTHNAWASPSYPAAVPIAREPHMQDHPFVDRCDTPIPSRAHRKEWSVNSARDINDSPTPQSRRKNRTLEDRVAPLQTPEHRARYQATVESVSGADLTPEMAAPEAQRSPSDNPWAERSRLPAHRSSRVPRTPSPIARSASSTPQRYPRRIKRRDRVVRFMSPIASVMRSPTKLLRRSPSGEERIPPTPNPYVDT
jgi:hypothetical protein